MRVLPTLAAVAVLGTALTGCASATTSTPGPPATGTPATGGAAVAGHTLPPPMISLAPTEVATILPSPSGSGGRTNGVENRPAADIAKAAADAMHAYASVHAIGFTSGDGLTVTFSLISHHRPAQDGADAICTMNSSGETITVIRVGAYDYVRASKSFWTTYGPPAVHSEGAAAAAAGKFVKASQSGLQLARTTNTLNIPSVVESELGEPDGITKGGIFDVDEQPTVAIISPTLGTVYVALVGAPVVVRVVSPGAGASAGAGAGSQWDFDGYQRSVTVTAPPADQVVDIANLPA